MTDWRTPDEAEVERLQKLLDETREALGEAIQDVLLIDSPEGDSPRNIAGNLRRALDKLSEGQ